MRNFLFTFHQMIFLFKEQNIDKNVQSYVSVLVSLNAASHVLTSRGNAWALYNVILLVKYEHIDK